MSKRLSIPLVSIVFTVAAIFCSAAPQAQPAGTLDQCRKSFQSASKTPDDQGYKKVESECKSVSAASDPRSEAAYYLGQIYEDSRWGGFDCDESLRQYGFSKFAAALSRLGTMYLYGTCLDKPDLDHARELLDKAVKAEDAKAAFALGYMYEQGWVDKKIDLKKAQASYELAIKMGHSVAYSNLGRVLESDPGKLLDAAKIYRKGVEKNDPRSGYRLGLLYRYSGDKMRSDNPERLAFSCFAWAALREDPFGQIELAKMRLDGLGGEPPSTVESLAYIFLARTPQVPRISEDTLDNHRKAALTVEKEIRERGKGNSNLEGAAQAWIDEKKFLEREELPCR